jgi:cytochrome oxidase assembly protein ShyY1
MAISNSSVPDGQKSAKLLWWQRLLATIAVLGLFAAFITLGLWQLHRAQAMKSMAHNQPERAIVNLNNQQASASDLRAANFNRLVFFNATFTGDYVARGQSQGSYRVALAHLPNGREILVATGLSGDSNYVKLNPATRYQVRGRLYPPQTQDLANGDVRNLSRLDPALLAQVGGDSLLAGYVIATSLGSTEASSTGLRAPQQLIQVGVPYYQHIAYVITWWFMALLVLLFPFYNRMRAGIRVGE